MKTSFTTTSAGFTSQDSIAQVSDVRRFFANLIIADQIGGGFHPENAFQDYRDSDGHVSFEESDAVLLEALMNKAFEVCERERGDIFDIASHIWLATGVFPDLDGRTLAMVVAPVGGKSSISDEEAKTIASNVVQLFKGVLSTGDGSDDDDFNSQHVPVFNKIGEVVNIVPDIS